jgi:hypothetical protein
MRCAAALGRKRFVALADAISEVALQAADCVLKSLALKH